MLDTSLFLAKLLGPTLITIGAAIVISPAQFRELVRDIFRSPALVFIIGHIALPAGLATVLVHNLWVSDWRVIITILGWLGIISGAVRILAPWKAAAGRTVMGRGALLGAGCLWMLLGLVLSYFGFGVHERQSQAF